MLDHWGYKFLGIGTALGYMELDLQNHRKATGGSTVGHGTSTIDPDHPVAKFVKAKCDEILKLSFDCELGTIPRNIRRVHVKLLQANPRLPQPIPLYTNDLLEDVTLIKNDFLYLLSKRLFYYLPSETAEFYGKPDLFGENITKKFPKARDDLERAGNCLALGEPTACVLHLMRAMEAIIERLARKLRVTINPRDTWGAILVNMDTAIKALPHAKAREQRKKDLWSECRANLFHVKNAWRDPSMHPRRNYDEKQARQILATVRVFVEQLATL